MNASPLNAVVIVVSDEVVREERDDRAGPVAVEALAQHQVSADVTVVGDEAADIAEAVTSALALGHRIVITCGGTGVGPRDVTADTVASLLTYELPGLAEEIRRRGTSSTAISLLSRVVAGVSVDVTRPPAFVMAAPGSRGGVKDAIAVVGPLLRYLMRQLDGTATH